MEITVFGVLVVVVVLVVLAVPVEKLRDSRAEPGEDRGLGLLSGGAR